MVSPANAMRLANAYLELHDYMASTGNGVAVCFEDGLSVMISGSTTADEQTGMPATVSVTRIDGDSHVRGLYDWSKDNLPAGEFRPVELETRKPKRRPTLSLVKAPEVS